MTTSQKGDFPTFLEQNKGIVFKVSQSYCRSAADREDLAQEIIIQLWRAFPKYDPGYKASTWVYRIALNVAISFHRKSLKRKEKSTNLNESLVQYHLESEGSDPRMALLYELIHQLNDLDKAIMLLFLEDYAYKEIAAITGLTETNVASKIRRIKKKLKKRVDKTTIKKTQK